MSANAIPERPSSVTLALRLLYLSLGIGVLAVVVAWVRLGMPGKSGHFLLDTLVMATLFHFQTPVTWSVQWATYGGLLTALIVPIALWLYSMIGQGKSWARITLLIFVLLRMLDLVLLLVICFSLPMHSRIPPSRSEYLLRLLISPNALQAVLEILAVALLFGGASSNWFRAVKMFGRAARRKSMPWITLTVVGLSVLLVTGLVGWQAVPWFRDKALIEAIRKNNAGEVQELLKKGADINAKDEFGQPALMIASKKGPMQIVELRKAYGAKE